MPSVSDALPAVGPPAGVIICYYSSDRDVGPHHHDDESAGPCEFGSEVTSANCSMRNGDPLAE